MAQRRLIAQQAREAEALAAAEKVRLRVEAEEAAIAKAAADREAQREAARSARAQARTVSAPRCPVRGAVLVLTGLWRRCTCRSNSIQWQPCSSY